MLKILGALVLLASALPAQGVTAPPLATPPAEQFDFWIGEWDVVNRFFRNGDWVVDGAATCRVHAAAGGKAVVEHWRGKTGAAERHGFSVRAWDPEIEKWVLVLNWPAGPDRTGFGTLEGVFRHGRGEFFSGAAPNLTRYSFSDITGERLRWDSSATKDGGKNWHTDWIMEFTRRTADAEPLSNGRTGTLGLATLPELRQLDFLMGKWRGKAAGVDEEGRRFEAEATFTSSTILEGLAVMESLSVAGKNGFVRFAVSSFDRRAGHWVRYVLDSRRPVFERQAGVRKGDVVEFTARDDEIVSKSVWKSAPSGSLELTRRVREEDEDPVEWSVKLAREDGN